jgi:hypothetical protein
MHIESHLDTLVTEEVPHCYLLGGFISWKSQQTTQLLLPLTDMNMLLRRLPAFFAIVA